MKARIVRDVLTEFYSREEHDGLMLVVVTDDTTHLMARDTTPVLDGKCVVYSDGAIMCSTVLQLYVGSKGLDS